jgi:hypothetical protein
MKIALPLHKKIKRYKLNSNGKFSIGKYDDASIRAQV